MKSYLKQRRVQLRVPKKKGIIPIPFRDSIAVKICENCKGWINPPWKRGDGDYRHCECETNRNQGFL